MVIIDNFIKDVSILNMVQEELNNGTDFWGRYGEYEWYEGWWNREPETLREQIINYIWNINCPISENIQIEGFEHWTGIQSATNKNHDNHLKHHFDKDEDLWLETGELVSPVIGTVYYPINHDIDGGELVIYDTHDIDFTAPCDVIRPVYNRLVVFDASKLHMVNEITRGTRYAMAINLWKEKPLTIKNNEQA